MEIQTSDGLAEAITRMQFQHILHVMIRHGVTPEAAAQASLEMAEFVRQIPTSRPLDQRKDTIAQQYEDIAARILNQEPLYRDPI